MKKHARFILTVLLAILIATVFIIALFIGREQKIDTARTYNNLFNIARSNPANQDLNNTELDQQLTEMGYKDSAVQEILTSDSEGVFYGKEVNTDKYTFTQQVGIDILLGLAVASVMWLAKRLLGVLT